MENKYKWKVDMQINWYNKSTNKQKIGKTYKRNNDLLLKF